MIERHFLTFPLISRFMIHLQSAHKFYSGRRVWGSYLLTGNEFPDDYTDLQSDPVYPISVKPKELLTVQDLFKMHRFTYQGTKYDLGANGLLAAGMYRSIECVCVCVCK